MPRPPRISDDDRELFREAVADVKPLPQTPSPPTAKRRPKPIARSRIADEMAVIEELLAEMPDGELETGEELSWRVPGVQDSVFKKLRRGAYRVERELDLHGFNATDAKTEVAIFIQQARGAGAQCVRIVHGKGRGSPEGRPVLKQLVGGWLRRHSGVLAYISARPSDGGTGALIVLLRRLA